MQGNSHGPRDNHLVIYPGSKRRERLNCGEVSDWIDREGWLAQTVDAIRARLMLEESALMKNFPALPSAPIEIPSRVVPPVDEATRTEELPPSQRLAYLAKRYAELKEGRKLTDNEAWDYLNANKIEEAGELDDYDVPEKQKTFADYMNRARRALNEPEYRPRGGRTGGSIAKPTEL